MKMKCFEKCEKLKTKCENYDCRHWINLENHSNCTLLASKSGPMTLQTIGDIFGITRMRICQIEKKVLEKIKPGLSSII